MAVPRRFEIPQGLGVRRDGAWTIGDHHVVHPASLRYFKAHLVFEDGGAFIVDGAQRMPVAVEGPAFEVTALVVEPARGAASAVLDDGSQEAISDSSLGMNADTGRFECVVRGGRARAVLTRAAHQSLLKHVEDDGGRFFLVAGERRIPVRA